MTDETGQATKEVFRADLNDPAHAKAIPELINAYAKSPMGIDESLPDDILKAIVPGLRQHPSCSVFIAYRNGDPVGIAVCFTGFSTFSAKPLINVHDISVNTEFRGQGIGRKILSAIEDEARRTGCCKLTLEVRTDNDNAKHLYQSFGFEGPQDHFDNAIFQFWTKPLTG